MNTSEKLDGELHYKSDTECCGNCTDVHLSGDLERVNINKRSSELWCSECVSKDAFFCNESLANYYRGFFSLVIVDGSSYCLSVVKDSLYYWDGEYRWIQPINIGKIIQRDAVCDDDKYICGWMREDGFWGLSAGEHIDGLIDEAIRVCGGKSEEVNAIEMRAIK
jgi:hypothetical protein